MKLGDEVRHRFSGWSGPVTALGLDPDAFQGGSVTVLPTHPRPKEVYVAARYVNGECVREGRFEPTSDEWHGWRPITVTADELELL